MARAVGVQVPLRVLHKAVNLTINSLFFNTKNVHPAKTVLSIINRDCSCLSSSPAVSRSITGCYNAKYREETEER